MIALLDNFDSFTHNLAHLLAARAHGHEVWVVRADQIAPEVLLENQPSHLVLSPGPGHPRDAATMLATLDLVATQHTSLPVLGVCLGHQAIAHFCGADVVHAPRVVHGETSEVIANACALFGSVPTTFSAMRYHSLMVMNASRPLRVTAQTHDGVVMALEHESLPWFGVQFHPESFLSERGAAMMDNFLHLGNRPIHIAPTDVGTVFRRGDANA